MTIIATGDRIFIEEIEEKETHGFEAMQSRGAPPQQGKIIATGPGRSKEDPMRLEVGDTVLFAKGAGTRVKIKGRTLVIMREGDAYCALR